MSKNIFDNLSYACNWESTYTLDLFGKSVLTDITIFGEEADGIADIQLDSFNRFIDHLDLINKALPQKILEYYQNERCELGYADEANELYPEITDAQQILNMIEIDSLIIPEPDIYDGRCVFLTFSCSWDDELEPHGMGIRFINEEIDEIGLDSIAF